MKPKLLLIQIIASLLIFLLVYAAVSKFLELEAFKANLRKSPLIRSYAGWVSVAIPVTELVMAALLILPRTRSAGLVGCFVLMLLFTGYIACLLLFADQLPCSCGGVLRMLGWKEHLLFNIFFALIAWTGFVVDRSNKGREKWRHSPV
jgi:hypothetical protein